MTTLTTTTCEVCSKIDPALPHTVNAERAGVSEATVRRHRKHYGQDTDPFFTDIPEGIITSRGKSVRLADGSWEKITYSPSKKALLDSLDYDDLERAIAGFDFKPSSGPVRRYGSELCLADVQVGKAGQRGGGTPETLTIVQRAYGGYIEHLQEAGRPEVTVLADLGDPIENMWNTPSQPFTNDLDLTAQIRVFRRLALEGLKQLLPHSNRLVYVAVPSNHGAVRTGPKAQAGTTDADFGLEIFEQLRDVCADHKVLSDVEFIRPEPLEETAVVREVGTVVAHAHGHRSGGVFKHGTWWQGQDHGRRPGWDADIAAFGHFHTPAKYMSGNGRTVVAAGSVDPGSDWFTNGCGESAPAVMSWFDFKDGQLIRDGLV